MSRSYRVMLSCGHWFTESRGDKLPEPVDGEKRSCGTLEHYDQVDPNKWTAVYQALESEQ